MSVAAGPGSRQDLGTRRYLSRATVLVSGTAGGQLIIILSSPILTRLYGPEDFGVLAVYAALLAGITLVASVRYELAIPLPHGEGPAASLLGLSLLFAVVTTLLTLGAVALWGEAAAQMANVPGLVPYLWLLPVGVFVGGWNKALTFWALRIGAFKQLAWIRLQQAAGMVSSQVALGMAGAGPFGLLVGQVVGIGTGLTGLIRKAGPSRRALRKATSLRRLWAVGRRYRRFPLFSTWSDVANVAGMQLPPILFATLFSPVTAGLYMLAQRVANIPVAFVSEAMGKSFLVAAVPARREGRLPDLALEVFSLLLRIGLAPLVLTAFIAPELFSVAFGPDWVEAGQYLRWISPWAASVFLFVPMMTLYVVLERQRTDLLFQGILAFARIGGLVAGARMGSVLLAVALYSLAASLVYSVFGLSLLVTSGVRPRRLLVEFAREARFVGMLAVILAVAHGLLDTSRPSILDRDTLILFAVAAACGVVAIVRATAATRRITVLAHRE